MPASNPETPDTEPNDSEFDEEEESESTSPSREKAADEQYCSSCGETIKKEAEICPKCGVKQSEDGDTSPGVAALLAGVGFIIPLLAGAGQVYNGEVGKGVVITVVQLINVGLAFLVIGLFTYPLVGIYAVYDAYKTADNAA